MSKPIGRVPPALEPTVGKADRTVGSPAAIIAPTRIASGNSDPEGSCVPLKRGGDP